MKRQLYLSSILVLSLLLFQNCDDSLISDTNKNLYYDDIADITYLNNSFYTTNYDLSQNAGSQIDLLRFEKRDQDVFLVNNFDMELNGHGYFAITNDKESLFLQSRKTFSIFNYSNLGELLYIQSDSISFEWQPSGICYLEEKDSLLLLSKNTNSPMQYRARIVDKSHPYISSTDYKFSFDFVDTTNYEIFSIDYYDSSFFLLGANNSSQRILLRTNINFEITSIDTIADSSVVGLCFEENNLYMSYQDKRIERWNSY